MLSTCTAVANYISLTFNASKSMCMAIGQLAKLLIEPMSSGAILIEWVNSIRYLGVMITGDNSLGFKNGSVKQSFCVACNCIYKLTLNSTEIMHLTLHESYCLPILIPILLLL